MLSFPQSLVEQQHFPMLLCLQGSLSEIENPVLVQQIHMNGLSMTIQHMLINVINGIIEHLQVLLKADR